MAAARRWAGNSSWGMWGRKALASRKTACPPDGSTTGTPASRILDAVYGPQRRGHGDRLVEDAYVIGSSRTPRLERLSLLGFATLLGAIALHGLARVVHALWKGGSDDG